LPIYLTLAMRLGTEIGRSRTAPKMFRTIACIPFISAVTRTVIHVLSIATADPSIHRLARVQPLPWSPHQAVLHASLFPHCQAADIQGLSLRHLY
jgi:hypothetical protein